MITTVIPTKNESLHIERCVRSVAPLGRVLVIDSESTDDTVHIAESVGATVITRAWTGYADQKNWVLANGDIDTDWVLLMDADEFLTAGARATIRDAIVATNVCGFWLPRRYVFLGRELKYAWWYPDFQLRLFRTGKGHFEPRLVHEHLVVDGPVSELWADLWHENLKGLVPFVEQHTKYARLEASELAKPTPGARKGSVMGGWAERRRVLKRLWLRLPGRPMIRFVWLYFLRQGFRDGRAGLIYCCLISWYDLLTNALVLESRVGSRPASYDTTSVHPRALRRRIYRIRGDAADDGIDPRDPLRRPTQRAL